MSYATRPSTCAGMKPSTSSSKVHIILVKNLFRTETQAQWCNTQRIKDQSENNANFFITQTQFMNSEKPTLKRELPVLLTTVGESKEET